MCRIKTGKYCMKGSILLIFSLIFLIIYLNSLIAGNLLITQICIFEWYLTIRNWLNPFLSIFFCTSNTAWKDLFCWILKQIHVTGQLPEASLSLSSKRLILKLGCGFLIKMEKTPNRITAKKLWILIIATTDL